MDNNKENLLDSYAEFLYDTSWYVHAHENNAAEFAYLFLGLAGETGEAVDAFKKIVRETGFFNSTAFREKLEDPELRTKLVHELGDVLWYLTRLVDMLGLSLEDLAVLNTRKLYTRLKEKGKIAADCPWPLPPHTFEHLNALALVAPDLAKGADPHE